MAEVANSHCTVCAAEVARVGRSAEVTASCDAEALGIETEGLPIVKSET